MAINFPKAGYDLLDEAGAREWCEDELDNFVDYIVQTMPETAMTVGSIGQAAKDYLVQEQEVPGMVAITIKCDGTNGLFLGLVRKVMAEYLQALVVDRFQA